MNKRQYYAFDCTLPNVNYGNIKISEHFTLREFTCHDNSRMVFIDCELIDVLEDVRNHFGKPVIVNSGYRTVAYNAKLKDSAPGSQHTLGKAADIKISGIEPAVIYNYLCSKYPSKFGIGIYNTFVHVDVRDVKSRFDKRTK